jgi:hypothetical protein
VEPSRSGSPSTTTFPSITFPVVNRIVNLPRTRQRGLR